MSSRNKLVVSEANVWEWLRDDERISDWDAQFVDFSDRERILEELATATAYAGIWFDQTMAARSTNLRLLQVTAAGTDHIARETLPSDLIVANSGGHGRSIAEHVVMVSLASLRGLLWRDRVLREGVWESRLVDPRTPRFPNIAGLRLGVVGLGHIGQHIVSLATAVGMRCAAITRSPEKHTDAQCEWVGSFGDTGRLFSECDIVVLACPLTEQTRGLVGRNELNALGPEGRLINVARGAIVDEGELYDALRERRIAGAALDVWNATASDTPTPSAFPFHDLDSVIMTPHYSATSDDTYRIRAGEVAENLAAFARGEVPDGFVYHTEAAG